MSDGPGDEQKRLTRIQIENDVRSSMHYQDEREACTRAIEGFGPEIYGFMMTTMRNDDLAQESFSRFCEDVVRGLADFHWKSSLRTWLYALARNACYRTRRNVTRGRLQLSDPSFAELEAQVRTRTAAFLRTENKDAIQDLRDELSEDDRELLVLRVDRDLSWQEIAHVFLADSADQELIAREAAACRKRFERAKERLRQLAVKRGLVSDKTS